MRNKRLIEPIASGATISLTLFLTIIVKSKTPFELNLVMMYLGFGVAGFAYSFLLRYFKMFLASTLFLVFTIVSGVYFYISMPKSPEVLSQLGAFMGWLLLMVISIFLPLVIELVIRLRKKKSK